MMGFEENMALAKDQQILVNNWLMGILKLKEIVRSPEGTDLDKVYKIDAYYIKSNNVRVTVQEHGHRFGKFLTVTIPTDMLHGDITPIRSQIGNGEYWEGCAQYLVTVYSDAERATQMLAIMVCNFQKLRDYIDTLEIDWENPKGNGFLNVNRETGKIFVHIQFERLLKDPKASGIVLRHYISDQIKDVYNRQNYQSSEFVKSLKAEALAKLRS